MKKTILMLALSSVSYAAFAQEEVADKTGDLYIQLNAGYMRGFKPGGDFGSGSLKRTGSYGIELGANVYEHLRASLSFDYMPDFTGTYISTLSSTDVSSYNINYNFKVKSYVAMANLYYDIAQINRFTPYLMVGVGAAQNKTYNINGNYINNTNNKTSPISIPGAKQNNFAYRAALGTRYDLNKAFSLDIRYQLADLGKFKSGSTGIVGSDNFSANCTGKLRIHGLIAGIVYKF